MTRFKPAAFLAATLTLTACTTSQGYEALRSAGQASAQCEQERTEAAQRACEAPYQTDYEDYQEQRGELARD